MDPFELPDELPADVEGLTALRAEAMGAFDELADAANSGDLDDAQMEALRTVAAAIDTIDAKLAEAQEAEEAKRAEAADLINRVRGGADDEEDGEDDESDPEGVDDESDDDEGDPEGTGDVVDEAEAIARDAAEQPVAASGAKRKTQFRGLNRGKTPAVRGKNAKEIGWVMAEGAPGYKPGPATFRDLAEGIESVRPGAFHRGGTQSPSRGAFAAQTIARLPREMQVVEDSHALVAAIEKATDENALPGRSLTAAGGWCAPSEQLYDFCEVPTAQDLISLPEIAIKRGGIRWPNEPDLSAIFESFQFFFTEPELEAEDVDGNPTAVKNCVEIPCPDTFTELRLNAVGYCVEAGILQQQGWPEVTEWFMKSLAQEHLRAMSRRTILTMANGSTGLIIPPAAQIAAGSSILNSLELMAINLRLDKGLGRTATIEGVAPVWLHGVIRADLAMHQGTDTKNVTDAQITAWLTARNIALQFVADWQTRETGQPGNLQTVEYPDTVDILLYPAGTWFRSMSNVIELGVMYPKEQLQVNRYTRFFTEDAYAVAKRCNKSLKVTVPIVPNGAVGGRQLIGVTP